jgi:hypothetical protein
MKSGDVFTFDETGTLKSKFERLSLGGGGSFDEKWLQKVLFENIELIKVSDPIYDKIRVVPLCRELTLNDGIRNLFLDVLAVTETGRLVLIECKLWKNPQARREVLAQTLEYATLIQKLSYSDLAAKLKKHLNSGIEDPISYRLREAGLRFDESLLIDRLSENIKQGDFHLIIAGDGIRGDLFNLVNSSLMSGMTADLSLLEIAVHKNSEGDIILCPSIPSETETVKRTVLLSTEGMPAIIEEDLEVQTEGVSSSGVSRPMHQEVKQTNTLFWQKAISQITFEHPDQEPLRRGGNNWCKVSMPDPLKWITAWRTKDKIGIFLRIAGEDIDFYQQFFSERIDTLKAEISPDIRIEVPEGKDGWAEAFFLSLRLDDIDTLNLATETRQLEWYTEYLNKYVNYLRPLVNQLPPN